MTRPEKEVANYLKELSLRWVFQFPIFLYDDKDRPRVWTPDFYIPELGLYIEVCGSEEFDYEYRKTMYEKNGHNVIFLQLYKVRKWKNYLVKRIGEIEEKRYAKVQNCVAKVHPASQTSNSTRYL